MLLLGKRELVFLGKLEVALKSSIVGTALPKQQSVKNCEFLGTRLSVV